MRYIKLNINKLKQEEINQEEIRIKALLINSKDEVLVGYSYKCYQFIGGHLEDGETLIECLKREIKEEAGIVLDIDSIEPFLLKEEYCKDYKTPGVNLNSKIYYFEVKTDLLPNHSLTNYTPEEKIGDFSYKYIKLDELEKTIINNYNKYEVAKVIGIEMLTAIKAYKKTRN